MFRKIRLLTFALIMNTLPSLAQSGLVFDRPTWDFGTIRETDGPVTHRFVCRNEGEHPEVILQVTTTCGCTTPRYTRKPILPGEETEITVTYDPANRPGNFSRELAVFTADRRIAAKLRITGSVIGRPKTPDPGAATRRGERTSSGGLSPPDRSERTRSPYLQLRPVGGQTPLRHTERVAHGLYRRSSYTDRHLSARLCRGRSPPGGTRKRPKVASEQKYY